MKEPTHCKPAPPPPNVRRHLSCGLPKAQFALPLTFCSCITSVNSIHPSRLGQKGSSSLPSFMPPHSRAPAASPCLPRPPCAHRQLTSVNSDNCRRVEVQMPCLACSTWHAVPAICPLAAAADLLLSPCPSSPGLNWYSLSHRQAPLPQAGMYTAFPATGPFWHPPRPAAQLPRTAPWSLYSVHMLSTGQVTQHPFPTSPGSCLLEQEQALSGVPCPRDSAPC